MLRPTAFLIVVCFALGSACSESEPELEPVRECTPSQFRACDIDDACSAGVQQCQITGSWGPCNCKLLDASYADHELDSAADAMPEADAGTVDDGEADADSDATGAADAEAGADAVIDVGATDS